MKMAEKKIAVISRTDSSAGGAGLVAEELTKLINTADNANAHLWIGYSNFNKDKHTYRLYRNKIGALVYKSARFISRSIGFSDFLPVEILSNLSSIKIKYDIYHFHSICAAFSPFSLNWIAKKIPSIWTFHDCSPFTGGCMYPSLTACNAFKTRCDHCSQLKEWPMLSRFDFTGFIQNYKKNIFKQGFVKAVTPSEWLAKEAVKSGMFDQKPTIIPNCVNTSIFKPINKLKARKSLSLPANEFIVLMSAAFLSDKRKGMEYAVRALAALKQKVHILALGNNVSELSKQNLKINFVGYVKDQNLLAQYYAAADVFIFPSLAESFGLVAIESIACGTPVIAFRTGGIPEIIQHDENGWLAETKEVNGLIAGLNIALSEPERLKRWSVFGRKKACEDYSQKKFLDSHLRLYDEILNF